MNILFVVQNFPPSKFGGVGASVYEVVHQLSKNNQVKVLSTDYKLPQGQIVKNKWIKDAGIEVMFVKTRNSVFSFIFFLYGFREIKKSNMVHLSSIFYLPTLIFAIYSRIIGKSFVVSPHGELYSAALSYKAWKKKPYLYILRWVFKKKTCFRATSKDEYTTIKDYFPESKVQIIPNFSSSNLLIKEIRLNQFIFLGRINPIKNIEDLILACIESKEFRKENYKLLLCGPSDDAMVGYEERLVKLIDKFDLTNNVIFTGEIDSPVKEKLISQSKALFLISHSENFGGVVLESLAQGTLVVASKGTPWQQLEIFNCGFWIENTPKVIALAMDALILMNKQTYDEMSGNALLFSKEFRAEKIIPLWEKLNLELQNNV
jgi:glycosyltransferase involved in cell wall biosynthesis